MGTGLFPACILIVLYILSIAFYNLKKKESTEKDATKLERKEQPVYRFKLKLTFDPKKTSLRNLGKWEIK